jgi:hypothetical protein
MEDAAGHGTELPFRALRITIVQLRSRKLQAAAANGTLSLKPFQLSKSLLPATFTFFSGECRFHSYPQHRPRHLLRLRQRHRQLFRLLATRLRQVGFAAAAATDDRSYVADPVAGRDAFAHQVL